MGKIVFRDRIPVPKSTYRCPDCDSPMVERTNRMTGDTFYGCSMYPRCTGTRTEDGIGHDNRERDDEDNEVLRWDREYD